MSEMTLDVVDLSHDARGIVRVDGKVGFVPGALPGERVRARLQHRGKQSDDYQLLEVEQASPDRSVPPCPHFNQCSGCSLQHMSPAAQLRFKQQQLQDALERIGGVRPELWLAPLQAQTTGYRRKARLSARFVEKKGRMLVGFRERNPRVVADIGSCSVLDARLGPKLAELASRLQQMKERSELPQIEVAFGDDSGCMVIRHMRPLAEADREILSAIGRDFDLSILLQASKPDQLEVLFDTGKSLRYALPAFAVELDFQPNDFTQVNAGINALMVSQAMHWLEPKADESILDLFCGLGNFTLPMARSGAQVTGVEGDAGLVARARENARKHGLDGQVSYAIADLSQDQSGAPWTKVPYQKILLDPPRAGAAEILKVLPGPSVERVVYVSCHPGTLARDAGTLVREHGFSLHAAGVMDMFPHTNHVEAMAVFVRPSKE
jgi:23S rRNA (uracil1939-C5)-methyltransferase